MKTYMNDAIIYETKMTTWGSAIYTVKNACTKAIGRIRNKINAHIYKGWIDYRNNCPGLIIPKNE